MKIQPNFLLYFSLLAGFILATDVMGQAGMNGSNPIITYNTTGSISIETQSPPSFLGGEEKLEAFVRHQLEEADAPIKLPKKTWLTATIDKSGKVISLVPSFDADPTLKREMERIAALMPRWEPGLINKKGVETKYQFYWKGKH